jgi:hypothetical protein
MKAAFSSACSVEREWSECGFRSLSWLEFPETLRERGKGRRASVRLDCFGIRLTVNSKAITNRHHSTSYKHGVCSRVEKAARELD